MQYTVVQITLSGTYGVNDLKEDLRTMYIRAGVKQENILFLFTDSQVTDEKFLVYINDLMSSGNIADLFPTEDKDGIISSMRLEVKSRGLVDSPENCWAVFIERVCRSLHVCLCFSPVTDSFRRRAIRFPALVNCTTIDWFQAWPEEALLSVSQRFLADVALGEDATAVVNFMPFSFLQVNKVSAAYLQTDGRYNYTTPKSFLELIRLFKIMLSRKRQARRALHVAMLSAACLLP
jgi:dynein heavy chain